jgi:hypothetical protein
MHCLGLIVYPAGHKRWGWAGELTLLGIPLFARAPLGSDVSKLRKQKFGYIFTFEFRVSKEAAERQ